MGMEHLTLRGEVSARLIPIAELPVPERDFVLWWRTRSQKEKDRYLVYQHHNLILAAGKTTFLASGMNSGTLKYFAVGTGAFTGPLAQDTTLSGEFFRKATGSFTVVSNQVTVETIFGTTEGNATYTSAGLFGGSASGTANSGTLMTEAAYRVTKTNAAILTSDWLLDVS